MTTDPVFWSAAGVAVLLMGISKGGLGMGLGALAMPIMALVMPPVQAAAIMLPILIVMDIVNVYAHRKNMRFDIFWRYLPHTLIGIGAGWALAQHTSDDLIRIVIGGISVVFALDYWLFNRAAAAPWKPNLLTTAASGSVCGFTSFVAHAGGPPFQLYILPQKLAKEPLVATGAITFAAINFAKLPPYYLLGQLSSENLSYAVCLIPLAPIGILIGVKSLAYIRSDVFYHISYAGSLIVGLRLLWVGCEGLGWL